MTGLFSPVQPGSEGCPPKMCADEVGDEDEGHCPGSLNPLKPPVLCFLSVKKRTNNTRPLIPASVRKPSCKNALFLVETVSYERGTPLHICMVCGPS